MKLFLNLLFCIVLHINIILAQGVTKFGQVTTSSPVFVNKNGNIGSTSLLNKNGKVISLPTLTTTAISAITPTTATSGGNITNDGGASVMTRGVCWSTAANPTTANYTTSDGTGTGIYTSSITGLSLGVTYYVRAYATNSAGTAYGNEFSFTTTIPGCSTVTDIEGNTYTAVLIGTQCWMSENLKTGKYRNNTNITNVADGNVWWTLATEAWCYYNNDAANNAVYGKLYNWFAVNNGNGICPADWHVPSDVEWTTLTDFLGGLAVAGGKIKESGTVHWQSPNIGATNTSGFTALPGGYRYDDGYFYNIYISGNFWSSTETSSSMAYFRFPYYSDSKVYRANNYKVLGYSVRCLRDY